MHDVRLLSVKRFTFRLLYIKHVVGVCQWSADLQIPSPAYVPQVLDPLRNGSTIMACTALVHRPAVAWSVSRRDILPELHKFICAMKL